jgi:hypothetical protein
VVERKNVSAGRILRIIFERRDPFVIVNLYEGIQCSLAGSMIHGAPSALAESQGGDRRNDRLLLSFPPGGCRVPSIL